MQQRVAATYGEDRVFWFGCERAVSGRGFRCQWIRFGKGQGYSGTGCQHFYWAVGSHRVDGLLGRFGMDATLALDTYIGFGSVTLTKFN